MIPLLCCSIMLLTVTLIHVLHMQKGDKGDPGPIGPAGPAGPKGTMGPRGVPGRDAPGSLSTSWPSCTYTSVKSRDGTPPGGNCLGYALRNRDLWGKYPLPAFNICDIDLYRSDIVLPAPVGSVGSVGPAGPDSKNKFILLDYIDVASPEPHQHPVPTPTPADTARLDAVLARMRELAATMFTDKARHG